MYTQLIILINQTYEIEQLFETNNNFFKNKIIYNNNEFVTWKARLNNQLIKNNFITKNLTKLLDDKNWMGWDDENTFKKLKAELITIKESITKYNFSVKIAVKNLFYEKERLNHVLKFDDFNHLLYESTGKKLSNKYYTTLENILNFENDCYYWTRECKKRIRNNVIFLFKKQNRKTNYCITIW